MQQKNKNIQFLGVPFCSGTNREGTQYAPRYLMECMRLFDSVYSMVKDSQKEYANSGFCEASVNNYRDVILMKEALRLEMSNVLDTHKNVIVLGGDHSISMGSITGVLDKYPNVGIIWIDAHTDINTEITSPSKNAHGMPLAALMGICNSKINNNEKRLNPKNVFWIGARDIDEGEWDNINKLGIEKNVFTCERVHKLGIKRVLQHIHTQLNENAVEQLHISFDVDVMDPLFFYATGTVVPNGFTEKDCELLISELFNIEMPRIVSMDFVEYNPLLDDSNHNNGMWCVKILKKIQQLLGF